MFELFSSSSVQVGNGRNCPNTMLKVVSEGSDYPGKIATVLASASDGIIGSLLSKHKQSQCSANRKLYLNTQQPPRENDSEVAQQPIRWSEFAIRFWVKIPVDQSIFRDQSNG